MGLLDFAYKNVCRDTYKYLMFFLSNALTVIVFFSFANFIFDTRISSVKYMGNAGLIVAQGLMLCETLIACFAVVFIHYSAVNFLRSREKEFGLLTLVGMTRGQIRKYVLLESLLVAAGSAVAGLMAGMVLAWVFLSVVATAAGFTGGIPFAVSLRLYF